ncbi:MAG: 30S ribosomal protein S2, partial [Pseudomonadota bacterium]
YCNLIADAVMDGLAESSAGLGIDLGEAEDIEALVEADVAAADAAEAETEETAEVSEDKTEA